VREASCSCGQLTLTAEGDPIRISMCHCEEHTFRFCPDCGATVFWTLAAVPDAIAVAIGAFADPTFPPPTISVYDSRRHPWVSLPDTVYDEE
jgi:hypothetical protein